MATNLRIYIYDVRKWNHACVLTQKVCVIHTSETGALAALAKEWPPYTYDLKYIGDRAVEIGTVI